MYSGARYERALARTFDEAGWMAMRSPSSGSATARDQPDILVAHEGRILAMELKTTGEPYIYLDDTEGQSLARFAASFGAEPRVVARFKGDTTYYCVGLDHCRRTAVDRYALTHSDLVERVEDDDVEYIGDVAVLPLGSTIGTDNPA